MCPQGARFSANHAVLLTAENLFIPTGWPSTKNLTRFGRVRKIWYSLPSLGYHYIFIIKSSEYMKYLEISPEKRLLFSLSRSNCHIKAPCKSWFPGVPNLGPLVASGRSRTWSTAAWTKMVMLVSSSKGWRKYFSDVASMAMMAMGEMGGVF